MNSKFDSKTPYMKRYKKKVQLQHYLNRLGMVHPELAPSLLAESEELMLTPAEGSLDPSGRLLFLHSGQLLGSHDPILDITRVIFPGEMVHADGLVQSTVCNWEAADVSIISSFDYQQVLTRLQLYGLDAEILINSLRDQEAEMEVMLDDLMSLSLTDKLTYLENYYPQLITHMKGKDLSRFLDIRPETLSREVKKRIG
ncbi:cyclic nucleotide-binding domain-containing protein [Litoribacter populi]|uniref:hypothetical protein n=1 Tax=Litoribacter populi TaxID=2598460 RepID=UPI00117F95B6|nr:hypothetical protein [Litoribacter populi]